MPHILFYFIFKSKLTRDIERSNEHHEVKDIKGVLGFVFLMCFDKSFRGLFYYRIGYFSFFIRWMLPTFRSLMINTHSLIGEGALFVHSFSTIVNHESIGKNFWISHNCTIGNSKGGRPVIKDNVTIHPGSLVFGNITIGNNVVIGAGSVVNKSIPDNCTVVGNPARIIRRDGIKVNENL